MNDFCLLLDDDGVHSLLEPQRPAYSNLTVRRAFIVWLHLGQKNDFEHVCKYYHRLEAIEEHQLSPEKRMKSRLREYSILFRPPTPPPQEEYIEPQLNNKSNKIEDSVFCLEGFHDMIIHKSITTKDIIKTSEMIKDHCKSHSKSLKHLLDEFHDFTRKTGTINSVINITMFIKNLIVKDELETWHNMPKHFSFLDDDFEDGKTDVSVTEVATKVDQGPTIVDQKVYLNKNVTKTRILVNESRRKEMMNLIPSFLKYQ